MRAEVSVAKGNLSILEFLLHLKHALSVCAICIKDGHNPKHNAIQPQFGQNDGSTCDASIVRSARADISVFCLQVVQRNNPAAAPNVGAKCLSSQTYGRWLRLLRCQCSNPLHSTKFCLQDHRYINT